MPDRPESGSRIEPASLVWQDETPVSDRYGDVYHSAQGGIGQARHVFLSGCGLPAVWAGCSHYAVLETGFGTGLNFLVTWAAWRADPARPTHLHFLSVEKHPFRVEDLARIHAHWPELSALSAALRARWPLLLPGFHRIVLEGGRVHLTLMLGEATDCLSRLDARIDAFYLDGFAPDRNPELWQPALLGHLARLGRDGARLATYTVAARVRRGLEAAGFVCEKHPGFGPKRHCLRAHRVGQWQPHPTSPQSALVIGAGVAGAAVAAALAGRGVGVTVLERASGPAQAASGNPVAVFRPVVSREDTPATRLTRAAFIHNLARWPDLPDVQWSRCGVLHLARDAAMADKTRQALHAFAPPEDYAQWVETEDAVVLANWPVDQGGVWYPRAGWVVPATLCRAWLSTAEVSVRCGQAVDRLQQGGQGWQALDERGTVLATAETLVLANAHAAKTLAPQAAWPIQAVRGQISRLPAHSLPAIQRVIAREGYVTPGVHPLVGATYEHNDLGTVPRKTSDLANLQRLETILPGASAGIDPDRMEGRAALRATLPDRLPVVGQIDNMPRAFVAAGYGSRGVVWAGLLGEMLADVLCGEPQALETDLVQVLSPARFRR